MTAQLSPKHTAAASQAEPQVQEPKALGEAPLRVHCWSRAHSPRPPGPSI